MSASGSKRMSIQTTPTLEELARQALLRNEALAISALEDLPTMLFPVLFKDAFNGRHTRIVKAMVAAWPFPCLPVGALMKTFNREIFQAVLDGLDVLLTQQVSPMRRKLQEIYFQWVHHEFWTGARTLDRQRSAETVSEKQALKPSPTRELGQRLKLITDLYFRFPLDEDEMSILQWARQRKDSILLCCVNLKIVSLSLPNVRRILTVFEPEHLEMLELSIDWSWCTLAQFAPYVSQMSNLHTLSLERIQKNRFRVDYISGIEGDFAKEFIAEFTRLHSLQHLSLNGIFFPHDHMKLLLGHLETPLETFAVTHCQLFQSHLKHVSQCQRLYHLKHLDMTGVLLCGLCMAPLATLLENVAHTLESLQLQGCGITDSQLHVLLPALGHCSQLTRLNLYSNHFSMDALCDLLLHTANLSKMTVEWYPAPLESYDELGYVFIERFSQLCLELLNTLRAIRQASRISFATDVCHQCGERCVYDLRCRLCPCFQ